jgi:lipopolysaccharide transport system ATP-binding protein
MVEGAHMSDVVIRTDNLSKKFTIGSQSNYNTVRNYNTLRDQIAMGVAGFFKSRKRAAESPNVFWALKDVSMEVKRGEVVGLIGRNGAGKSTLLKVLSRITEPSSGFAKIRGRVASLLEVGTGFHAELTGRENTYLNGAILGMKRAEIRRKFDDIVDFAEIHKFIDTPVKRYSTGMYLRLAFAVAAHLESEILFVDEVLAVGDAAFQRKCLGKMGEVARDGRTILFVSHNLEAVERLCATARMLTQGRITCSGSSKDVIAAYLSSSPNVTQETLENRRDRRGDGKLRFTDIRFLSEDGMEIEVVQAGQDVQFSVGYRAGDRDLKNLVISIDIFAPSGQCMVIMNSEVVGIDFSSAPTCGRFICRVERFPLAPGTYYINVFGMVNGSIADWIQQAAILTVEAGDFYGSGRMPLNTHGGFLVLQEWNLERSPIAAGSAAGD